MKKRGTKRKISSLHKSRGPYGRPEYKKPRYAMYKSPRLGWPQEYVTTLKYTTLVPINNAGTTFATNFLKSNAYDVDPGFASTAMPGFGEYALIYRSFRPLAMSYSASFVNLETFPLCCACVFSNIAGPVLSQSTLGNPLCKFAMLGAVGAQSRMTLKDSATIVAIAGTKQALYDDLYTGSTTASTLSTNGTNYLHYFIESAGPVLVNGAHILLVLALKVQFFKANTLGV